MKPAETIKQTVRTDYGQIARLTDTQGVDWQRQHICHPIYDDIQAAYRLTPGYFDDANLGLGCSHPVKWARVQPGETVLDLGCAAGIDSFIAQAAVGDGGRVIGLDLTPELVGRAQAIAQREGLGNITFLVADLEAIPLPDASVDVVISNGVFSLVPDKAKAFAEIARVLRPGGRCCVADLMRRSELLPDLARDLEAFTGCFNGIYHQDTYLEGLRAAGLKHVKIIHERQVVLPGPLLAPHLDEPARAEFLHLWATTVGGIKNVKCKM